MVILKDSRKIKKRIRVSADVVNGNFESSFQKEKIMQSSMIDVDIDTKFPLPIVMPVMSPTRYGTQKIRGFRPDASFSIELNGSTQGVTYSGREFFKTVDLSEGFNIFFVTMVRGLDRSDPIEIRIERRTTAPYTKILVDNIEVGHSTIVNTNIDISFSATSLIPNVSTYFRIDNGPIRVYHRPVLLTQEQMYEIEYWSIDSVGNEEFPHNNAIINIDKTPPSAPQIDLSSLPAKTRNTVISVTGTCSSDTTRVEVNGDTGFVVGNTWSVLVSLLDEGLNFISAIGFDEAGNVSNPSLASIIRDTTPPTVPGLITNISRTRAGHIRLIGTKSEDSLVITVNDSIADVRLTAPERWAYDTTLQEGDNYFSVVAADDVGNLSGSLAFFITRDTTPPPAPAVDPVITPTRIASQLLTGSCSLDTVKIKINNDASHSVILPGGRWSALVLLENENLNVLEITAEDDLENRSDPTTVGILLDRIPPLAPTIDAISIFTKHTSLLITGRKTTDTVEVFLNDSSVGVSYPDSSRWQKSVDLNTGPNFFDVYGRDELGNISTRNNLFVISKPFPPAITIDQAADLTLHEVYVVSGTREAGSHIKIGNSITGIVYPDGLAGILWQASLDLNLGQNNFTFTATDAANNENTISFSIDRERPLSAGALTIESVYSMGDESKGRVKHEGIDTPLLKTGRPQLFFITGKKPLGINVISNIGHVQFPSGLNGDTWSLLIPDFELKNGVVIIRLQADRLLNPPEIVITGILKAESIFGGDILLDLGGNINLSIEQGATIVATDYQFRNTASPLPGVELSSIFKLTRLV